MRNFNITVDGKTYSVQVDEVGGGQPQMQSVAPVVQAAPKVAVPQGGTQVASPMPGTILALKFASGATVKEGDVIAVLEAMKMENDIVSPANGTITYVATKGATLNSGDVIASIN